jgi:Rieske Fe-S protein
MTTALPRRTLLVTGGAIGAAAALAACGGGDAGTAQADGDTTASAADGSDAASTGEEPQVLGPVDQVAVGSGVVYDGPKVVVTQPAEGQVKGFTAVCPHQGCLVSEVVNNEILCPCHGSLFSAEDGAVIMGPATSGLTAVPVSVVGDDVVLG